LCIRNAKRFCQKLPAIQWV